MSSFLNLLFHICSDLVTALYEELPEEQTVRTEASHADCQWIWIRRLHSWPSGCSLHFQLDIGLFYMFILSASDAGHEDHSGQAFRLFIGLHQSL